MDDDMIITLNSEREEIEKRIKAHQSDSDKSNQRINQFLEKSNLTEEDIKRCENVTPLDFFDDFPLSENDLPF